MGNYLTSTGTKPEEHVHVKPATRSTNGKGRPNIKLQDLPEDVLCSILSKLPAKEVVQTSVLASEWRSLWTACPKLSFNGAHTHGVKQHAQVFVDRVNAVLRKHRGKFVDELEVKFMFESKLVHHLDNWIRFAISSRTKKLAFDLTPSSNLLRHGYHYTFPFHLLDKESLSCLHFLQLSFVCFKPPSHFVGLPNLRKLDLYLLKGTTRQDLENILGNCCKLECLSLVRCHLNDELRVVQPLSHLHYLKVIYCEITKIEFHTASLSTFLYDGTYIPIALRHASKLENAKISFRGAVFRHAVASLISGLPDVQNMTLDVLILQLETRWALNSPRVFSQLRHVQIMLMISHGDFDKILYIVSFLRVAPFIERLEVHFNGISTMWFANEGPFRQEIPPCEYTHLKNIRVSGFRGARGQVEFLMHIVENAPAIQVVTVDTTQRLTDAWDPDEVKPELNSDALDMVRRPLLDRLPSGAKLFLA